jgi:hypothetical protein
MYYHLFFGRQAMDLFTTGAPRNSEHISRIKRQVAALLAVSDDTTVMVAELACREEGCPPVETVIAVFQPNASKLQFKLHKPVAEVTEDDLARLCRNPTQSEHSHEENHTSHGE